jgi:RimJ/RimL family protein N-acetyltransferase
MANPVSPVRLAPWSPDDLPLLHAANAPVLTAHLGGPETEEQIAARHHRYLAAAAGTAGSGGAYRVLVPGPAEHREGGPAPAGAGAGESGAVREAAGIICFWESEWEGRPVYETGWTVLAAFQGRGIATAAARAVTAEARAAGHHRYLHAFPRLANTASNAVCRKAGFELVGACEVDYPPGEFHPSNNWRFDLTAPIPQRR